MLGDHQFVQPVSIVRYCAPGTRPVEEDHAILLDTGTYEHRAVPLPQDLALVIVVMSAGTVGTAGRDNGSGSVTVERLGRLVVSLYPGTFHRVTDHCHLTGQWRIESGIYHLLGNAGLGAADAGRIRCPRRSTL